MLGDFRYASRSLRKSPGLATAAILTLALGIGANTAIFSVLKGVVLDPLPFPDSGRLVVVALFNNALKYPTDLSYPDFLDWQRDSRSFEQIAAFANDGFDLTAPGAPEHLNGQEVSANFFRTLNVPLALGRGFSADEGETGGSPAVVISDRVLEDRFGGSPAAVGSALALNGVDYTVVGVLRPGFRFGDQQADVYTSIARRNPLYIKDRTVHDILCIARLRPGTSVGQARAEMNTVQEHIDALNPDTERGQGAYVVPLKQLLIGDIGGTLLLLLGAVGVVLLIACLNVANLMLSRSATRTREFAIRLALGASRAQIARQLLAECLVLSLSGGLLGLGIAKWGVSVALAAAAGAVPRADNIGVDTAVMLFALGTSLGTGFLFGLFPAFKSSNTDVQSGLKAGGRGLVGGHQRAQHVLLVIQVALALVLLSGGSLLLRTIQNLWTVNPGFNPRDVITFQVGLSREAASTPARTRIAYQQLIERVRQIPGVSADIAGLVPLGRGANEGPFWIGPHQPASMAEIPRAIYYPVGPDYIQAMRIPLIRGRSLLRSDNQDSNLVLLVDDLLARRFFPGQDAVGRSITIPHWGAAQNVSAEIVGIVGHVHQYGLDGSAGEKPQIYYSFYQLPDDALPMFRSAVEVVARTELRAAALMPAARNAVRQAGSEEPIYNVVTMQQLVSRSMGRQRFPMLLLVAFASLALLLAFVGIYGVVSYSTARRANELAIRMALGATRSNVVRIVVGQGLKLALAGVAIGVPATLVLTRAVSRFSRLLYGVRASDPIVLLAVAVVLISAALLACYVPARRASSLDPGVSLRQE